MKLKDFNCIPEKIFVFNYDWDDFMEQYGNMLSVDNEMDLAINAGYKTQIRSVSKIADTNHVFEVDVTNVSKADMEKSKAYNWCVLNNKVTDLTGFRNAMLEQLQDSIDRFEWNDYDLSDCDEYDASPENFAYFFICLCRDKYILSDTGIVVSDIEIATINSWLNDGTGQFLPDMVANCLPEREIS